jgi:hypothetical protein
MLGLSCDGPDRLPIILDHDSGYNGIIESLQEEKRRIETAISILEGTPARSTNGRRRGAGKATNGRRKGARRGRRLSAAARKRISEAAKARWAAARKAGKKAL